MRGSFGFSLIMMHAVLWAITYAATRRAYRLRAQHPQRYQLSTWARFFAGAFRSPRHAAQFGAGMTGGTAIGAASAAFIRRVFATPQTQSWALLGVNCDLDCGGMGVCAVAQPTPTAWYTALYIENDFTKQQTMRFHGAYTPTKPVRKRKA